MVAFAFIYQSCSPKVTQAVEDDYYEDLSRLRPQVPKFKADKIAKGETEEKEIEPTGHIWTQVDSAIAIATSKNKDRGYVNGFTIQVYSGTQREVANETRTAVDILLEGSEEDHETFMKYYQPNYIINVGKFHSQLDALNMFNIIKEQYSSAIIVPDRIYLEF